MSPTVYPSGNGSVGWQTTVEYWVIQACPRSVGTTPRTAPAPAPTVACPCSCPTNVVPTIDSWWKGVPSGSSPRACSAAMTAQVPVPHGERSSMPVHVSGRDHSRLLLDMTTALRACSPPHGMRLAGSRKTRMSGPG
eukprot:scaffold52377_cov72-Phaeocystis_antarctica.AAC.7